ncbi:MAG: hypothetical protein IPH10_07635 [bacterium]|nr:hypothetical protein [bacterium]
MNRPRFSVQVFWLSAALYCLQCSKALRIAPLYDDWPLIVGAERCLSGDGVVRGLLNFFESPLFIMWRPLHVMHFALADGESLFWVQLVKLAAILICGLSLVWSARAIGLSRPASYIAGAVLFLHQCQVLGGEPDLMGDVIVTLSAILVVGLVGQYAYGKRPARDYAALTGLLTAFACMGKEAGVMIPVIPLVAWAIRDRRALSARNGHMYAIAVSAAVVAAYLTIRTLVLGLPLSDSGSDWSFHYGGNILYNIALISGALICPVSTIQIFLRNTPLTILAVVCSAVVAGLLIYGVLRLRKDENLKRVMWLVILFVLMQGPALLFEHTNERNFSRSLPLGILACSFAVSAIWKRSRAGVKLMLVSLLGVWIVLSQAATYDKIDAIMRMHARGTDFLDQVQHLMPTPPDRPILFACESAPQGYSEYDQPFWVFMPGTSDLGLQHRYHAPGFRSDFVVVDSLAASPDADFWVSKDGKVARSR